jgi:hypothetical protein
VARLYLGRPTIRLSRAAERATIKRHGQTKENMFVYRCWRRRLQAAVGPEHGRRRAFGSPDRERGRVTEIADMGRDVTRCDPTTDSPARDPAPSDPARDDHPSRRALRHATIIAYPMMSGCVWVCLRAFFLVLCPVASRILPGCPVVRLSGGAAARWRDDVLLCPIMSGYVRLCPVMSGYVRLYPLSGLSGCSDGSARCVGLRAAQRWRLAAPPNAPR